MSESTCLESLDSAFQYGGIPKLVKIFHQLLSDKDILPKSSSAEAGESGAASSSVHQDKDWQPLGIQVAHTLLSLCIYPQSTVKLAGDGSLDTGNLALIPQLPLATPSQPKKAVLPPLQVVPKEVSPTEMKTQRPFTLSRNQSSPIAPTPIPVHRVNKRRKSLIDTATAQNLEKCLDLSKQHYSEKLHEHEEKLISPESVDSPKKGGKRRSIFNFFGNSSEVQEIPPEAEPSSKTRHPSPLSQLRDQKPSFKKYIATAVLATTSPPRSPMQANSSSKLLSKVSSFGKPVAQKSKSLHSLLPKSPKFSDSVNDEAKQDANNEEEDEDSAIPGQIEDTEWQSVDWLNEQRMENLEKAIPSKNSWEGKEKKFHPSLGAINEDRERKNSTAATSTLFSTSSANVVESGEVQPPGVTTGVEKSKVSTTQSDRERESMNGDRDSLGDSNVFKSARSLSAGKETIRKSLDSMNERTSNRVSGLFAKKKPRLLAVSEEIMRKRNLLKLAEEVHLQAEEEAKIRERPPRWWLMHPTSTGHWCWDLFMTGNLVYVLLFAPVNVCFETEMFQYPNWAWAVDQAVNAGFCVDIIVNFITGVYILENREGVVSESANRRISSDYIDHTIASDDLHDTFESQEELFRKEERLSYKLTDIWLRYLKSWFLIDIVTVFPWDVVLMNLVSGLIDVGAASKLAKLLRLARLIKLLKLHRLRTFMAFLSRNFSLTLLELVNMFLGVCILSHYVACGFFFVALMTNETGEGTWLESYLEDPKAIHTTPARELYLNSIYWGFTTVTSVGYGDVLPITEAEKTYALFVMYCGVAMMSVITGKLTAVLANFNAQGAQMQAQLQCVKSYCKYRELPWDLRKSVTEYFEVRCAQKAVCNEEEILRDMSPSLKAQVVCYIFKQVIKSVPFFRGCSELFLSAVLCCMEPILFAPADIIIQKGQRELAMYVITKGKAAVVSSKGKVIKELSMGTSIGEIGLFFGVRRTATVCSISFCDTFKLIQKNFLEVQEMYPDMQQLIDEQAEAMFNESMTCYICNKPGHVSVQCPDAAMFANGDVNGKVQFSHTSSEMTVQASIHSDDKVDKRGSFLDNAIQNLITPSTADYTSFAKSIEIPRNAPGKHVELSNQINENANALSPTSSGGNTLGVVDSSLDLCTDDVGGMIKNLITPSCTVMSQAHVESLMQANPDKQRRQSKPEETCQVSSPGKIPNGSNTDGIHQESSAGKIHQDSSRSRPLRNSSSVGNEETAPG